jgi:putative ATP-dependent endonuclease of OLD family
MRLKKFEIKNFKGIEELSLTWGDLIVLLGENNCGKSSVLGALSSFLSGSSIKDLSMFRGHLAGPERAIELTGHFDLLSAAELSETAIRGRTINGEWILKKRYWIEPNLEGDLEIGVWKEQLFSYNGGEEFVGWPAADTTWTAFPPEYADLIADIPGQPARPNAGARESLRELTRQNRPDLVIATAPSWVPNPGGGGNWKSNANSVLPRVIYVRAVHEATDETNAKDASTYGKLINLIVERQLAQRPELLALHAALEGVFRLFNRDDDHPEWQAPEIQNLQEEINRGLAEVIGGQALIKTEMPEIPSLLMPGTSLVIRDAIGGIETHVSHQGHGLQRTLVMTLLKLLSDAQGTPGAPVRPTILMVEEPELYMHPQMERRVRDVLYRLSEQPDLQVVCCTHSPIFVDIAHHYRSIVRLNKAVDGRVRAYQCTLDLFPTPGDQAEKERLHAVARFNPVVNEVFFTSQVVLMEEFSAIVAFDKAAELTGIFARHVRRKHEVTLIDCAGKNNLPGFQRILNKFEIPYRVVHDADLGNAAAAAVNQKIADAAAPNALASVHLLQPTDLETLLGYQAPSKEKPFHAYRQVQQLHAQNAFPVPFIEALNFVYFGQLYEPV